MSELLNKVSSDNLILICIIMSIIALFLAIAISIELFGKYRLKRKYHETIIKDTDTEKINIKEDSNITYVSEDDELEKTAAKLELERLKERLATEEQEKKKLLEINLALTKKEEKTLPAIEESKENKVENIETLEKEIVVEPKKEEIEILEEESPNDKISLYEELEEENAIISYDELKKAAVFGFTDEAMNKYIDEKDAIISIDELEKLYKESDEMEEVQLFDIKRVEDLPEISNEKKFQSSPYISPVYGLGATEESIQLEQTANLERLNDEIRKTNEFLKTLKELKKNLQ